MRRRLAILTLLTNAVPPTSSAQRLMDTPDAQCALLPLATLMARAAGAPARFHVAGPRGVWPGGDAVTVTVPRAGSAFTAWCVRLREGNAHVRVVTVLPDSAAPDARRLLTLALPVVRFGPQQTRELLLVEFPVDSGGALVVGAPRMAASQDVRLSNGGFAVVGSAGALVIAYLLAVMALGRVEGKRRFDPTLLTAGVMGRASLSQLQIFVFTLLVLGLLVYVLLRTGVLSDVSEDVLLLLGISAAGTAGAKVAGVMKRRLTFENWSWLRNEGWLVGYEAGTGSARKSALTRWGDLLRNGEGFDVYSFQLATVSLLVAGALIGQARDIATFTIPTNLLALLGLSNVVYIGGKAVDPNSFGELDQKTTAVREALQAWLGAAAAPVAAAQAPADKVAAAKAAAPAEYQTYVAAAREAARMVKSLYGAGSKFAHDPIPEADLAPTFT